MRKVYDGFVKVLQAWSALLAIAMLLLVLVGVFYRYVVDSALSWYDEFAGWVLVWLTMYGSVVALAKRKHISFDTLVEKFPPRVRRAVEAFGIICVMAFSLVMLVSGWELIREMADETAVSVPALKMAWVYSVMPISGGLMFLIGLVQLVEVLGGIARGRPPEIGTAKPMEEAQ